MSNVTTQKAIVDLLAEANNALQPVAALVFDEGVSADDVRRDARRGFERATELIRRAQALSR